MVKKEMKDMSDDLTKLRVGEENCSDWIDEKILDGLKYARLYPQFKGEGDVLEAEWEDRLNRKRLTLNKQELEINKKQIKISTASLWIAIFMLAATILLVFANVNLAASSQRLADITEAAYQPLSLSLMEGRDVLLYSPEAETWPTRIYVTNRTPTNLHLGSSEIWLNCKNVGIKRIPYSLSKPLEGNTQTYFLVDIDKEIYGNIEQKDKCTFNITVAATNGWDAKLLEVPFVQQ